MPNQIQYKGYKYDDYVDREDDNIKIFHDCISPEGKTRVSMDYSPYFHMTQEAFELFIDCGRPDRRTFQSNGPMSVEQLRKLKSERAA